MKEPRVKLHEIEILDTDEWETSWRRRVHGGWLYETVRFRDDVTTIAMSSAFVPESDDAVWMTETIGRIRTIATHGLIEVDGIGAANLDDGLNEAKERLQRIVEATEGL